MIPTPATPARADAGPADTEATPAPQEAPQPAPITTAGEAFANPVRHPHVAPRPPRAAMHTAPPATPAIPAAAPVAIPVTSLSGKPAPTPARDDTPAPSADGTTIAAAVDPMAPQPPALLHAPQPAQPGATPVLTPVATTPAATEASSAANPPPLNANPQTSDATPPTRQLTAALAATRATLVAGQPLSIQLNPDALGGIHVRIVRGPDAPTRVEIAATEASTLTLLRADTAALHTALDQAGLPVAGHHLVLTLAQPADQPPAQPPAQLTPSHPAPSQPDPAASQPQASSQTAMHAQSDQHHAPNRHPQARIPSGESRAGAATDAIPQQSSVPARRAYRAAGLDITA